MSLILDHARAMRVLADVWADEFTAQTDPQLAAMAGMLAHGFGAASDRLIGEAAADAREWAASARCTIDHTAIKGPACPACKAPTK